jgi:hypothetical protein
MPGVERPRLLGSCRKRQGRGVTRLSTSTSGPGEALAAEPGWGQRDLVRLVRYEFDHPVGNGGVRLLVSRGNCVFISFGAPRAAIGPGRSAARYPEAIVVVSGAARTVGP